jgi:amino acid transporter
LLVGYFQDPSPSANPAGILEARGPFRSAEGPLLSTLQTRPSSPRIQVVLATTVLLSFISFWRAAAIVLADLGSTAYYVGGIAEQAIGKAAPWFILGVMLFSYAVCAVYIESSAMFVRGGVYRVVKEAMGGTMAKLSVSALLFDYILTGPISAVSAGQYIAGLLNEVSARFALPLHVPANDTAALLAILVTLYFWRRNTRGLHESTDDALKIMQITTVMVVILVSWCLLTLMRRGGQLPPVPSLGHMHFSPEALGWLKGTRWSTFTAVAVVVGFGHSIFAMSGMETLAQVYREIEHPKVKNLQRTGLAIFVYSLLFTSLVSFFAVALIPDSVRPKFYDNLISGLAMNLVGPVWMRLLFQGFVVIVGFLILAGAVNTAIIGSSGVLNRVSEDGVLPAWFRQPHRRFGTSYRIINLVAGLQILTILLSRGNVYLLGEAYAFGVVWSFALKACAVLVLRFTEPGSREWRVPLNVRLGTLELPIGLGLITLVLFSAAFVNLLTKQVATVWGLGFTLALYGSFVLTERSTARRRAARSDLDQFQLVTAQKVSQEDVGVPTGNVLVPVRDYNTLTHLAWALQTYRDRSIVVLTARIMKGPDSGAKGFDEEELFTDYEQLLFTKVVAAAEREGRPVRLLIVPSSDPYSAIAQTAFRLGSAEVVMGESANFTAVDFAQLVGDAWEKIPGSRSRQVRLVVCSTDGRHEEFNLGVHAPDLTTNDLNVIHELWLDAYKNIGPQVHHRDIVSAALRELMAGLSSEQRQAILARLRKQTTPKEDTSSRRH